MLFLYIFKSVTIMHKVLNNQPTLNCSVSVDYISCLLSESSSWVVIFPLYLLRYFFIIFS